MLSRAAFMFCAAALALALTGCGSPADAAQTFSLNFRTLDDRNITPGVAAHVAVPEGLQLVADGAPAENRDSVVTFRPREGRCRPTITVVATSAQRPERVDPEQELSLYEQARPAQRELLVAGPKRAAMPAATILARGNVGGQEVVIGRLVTAAPGQSRTLLNVTADAEPDPDKVCAEIPGSDGARQVIQIIQSLRLHAR